MNRQLILQNYFKIIVLNIVLQITLRLLETLLIVQNFGIQESLIRSELIGVLCDLIFTNALLMFLFPVFYFFFWVSEKLAKMVFIISITILTVIHFLILKYFLYQLLPLDTFLYQYSIKEVLFTIKTSNTGFTEVFFLLLGLLAIIFLVTRLLKRNNYAKQLVYSIYIFCLISIPLFVFTCMTHPNYNKFSKNKSFFFYSHSISYFIKGESSLEKYSIQDALEFQDLYPDKSFINQEYPLLHEFNDTNELGSFFNRFDSAPNIVILIVEGLNDDFIHPYRGGVNLMPFLNNLTSKSLYWNRCFTLGERSFAAVPSIMGSLPYGETGFTFLDKLPRHFSLVSILKANNYQTNFFYGQGSWFHRKDRFFEFNDVDLTFDNSSFSEKYKKIIVGTDSFFWGYNDKDLFNQSLEVVDTLPKKSRLDVYFTGTSHSPFVISDNDFYNKKFSEIINSINNDSITKFYNLYKKYVQSVLFVDDAVEDFLKKYKERPEYNNTIFIITGDHPMTEMPRANSLKRYHVPLIIYSPKLKNSKLLTQTVSHLDIYESVLSLLSDYKIKVPQISTALGSRLNIDNTYRDTKLAFMNDNREIVDFYSGNFYLSEGKLYLVDKDLSLTVSNNKNASIKLQKELEIFKKTSLYISVNDKILSDSLYCKELNFNRVFSESNNADLIKFESEYYKLVNTTEIKNKPSFFDISFDYFSKVDENFSIVYQLSTKNDQAILWKNSGIAYDGKNYQAHIKISKQDISDTIIYFKSYLWNKNKQNFSFNNLKILLYQKNN